MREGDTYAEPVDPPEGLRRRGGARPRGAAAPGEQGRNDLAEPAIDDVTPRDRRGTPFQRARAWLVAVASWIAVHLPEGFVLRLADLAGDAWYRASPGRAAVARANLGRVADALAARGTGSPAALAAAADPLALERLVRAAYRHAARYYLEVMRMPRLDARMLRERLLIETPDVVERAFEDPDRPAVWVALHFGAVELPGLYLARRSGRPATAPMETIADPELQRWFVRTRGRVGVRIVTLEAARRELAAALRRGEPVGLVADRDLTGTGLQVPLFGTPARLPIGPALLAIESGAPLYVVGVRRAGPARYRGQLREIEVVREGPRRQRLTSTMTHIAAAFEETIAEAPEQWWAAFFPIWPDTEAESAARTAALADATRAREERSAAAVAAPELRAGISRVPASRLATRALERARPVVGDGARRARPFLAGARRSALRGVAAVRERATGRGDRGTPPG